MFENLGLARVVVRQNPGTAESAVLGQTLHSTFGNITPQKNDFWYIYMYVFPTQYSYGLFLSISCHRDVSARYKKHEYTFPRAASFSARSAQTRSVRGRRAPHGLETARAGTGRRRPRNSAAERAVERARFRPEIGFQRMSG